MKNTDNSLKMSLSTFLEQLAANEIKSKAIIDLSSQGIDPEGATAIANAMSANWPYGITLNLANNHIGNEGLKAICKAIIYSDAYCEGIKIDFSNNQIGNQGAQSFAEILKIRTSLDNTEFDLSYNMITNIGAKAIALGLRNIDKYQKDIRINLEGNKINQIGTAYFADTISDTKCITALKLSQGLAEDLDLIKQKCLINKLDNEEFLQNATLQDLLTAIAEDRYPKDYEKIYLEVNDNEAKAIADMLVSGHCPMGFKIDFKKISSRGIKFIAAALATGNCPHNIAFTFYQLTDEDLIVLAQALASGLCPNGLSLTFDFMIFPLTGGLALANSIASNYCPVGLAINMQACHMDCILINAFSEALRMSQSPPYLKLSFANSIIQIENQNDDEDYLNDLARAIQYVNQGFTVDLSYHPIGNTGINNFLAGLHNVKFHSDLIMIFRYCNIGEDPENEYQNELMEFPKIFSTSDWTEGQGLTIDFSNNRITDVGGYNIAKALRTKQIPKNFSLNLENNLITDCSAQSILYAIGTYNFPSGFKLNLAYNHISSSTSGDTIALYLAETLAGCNGREDLEIDLRGNGIGTRGALAIAETLYTDNGHIGLKLNLKDNNLGEEGIEALTKAMMSNTSVVSLQASGASVRCQRIIDYCCLRNKLLRKYQNTPTVNFIKYLSKKAGFDLDIIPKTVPSLKFIALNFFASNSYIMDKEDVLMQLPQELIEELQSLEEIYHLEPSWQNEDKCNNNSTYI